LSVPRIATLAAAAVTRVNHVLETASSPDFFSSLLISRQISLVQASARRVKKRSEKSVGLSGPLLTIVFALSGAPTSQKPVREGDTPSTPSRDSTGPEADRSLRPAACWTLSAPSFICFSCSFSAGPGGLLLAATRVG
jgi:hypothetical protein